jgi:hypothetical protein
MSIADEFESFDLILDKLLRRKSNLANASLFPTERIEVNPEEIFKATGCGTGETGSFHSLSIKDIDIIDPYLFEAVVAQLFSTTNKDAILTPKSNDHGADVLVMDQDDKNYAIQVKLSSKDLGDYVIGEVLKAKSYYNDLFQMEFIPAIATNSVLNSAAQKMAETAGIHVFNRNKIAEMLSTNKMSIMDVHEREKKRKTSL